MKQLSTRLLVILPALFLFVPVQLKAQNGSAPSSLDGFDGFVEQVMKDWSVPGLAVAIVKDGKVIYAKGYGYRDLKRGLKVTPDTLFAIGSCSKSFTVTALALLADEGKLDWDKPVRDYLPDFRLADADATEHLRPRDLVTHQSGVPRHDFVFIRSPLSRRELYDRLRYLEPSKPPHAQFQYNNLMYMTAGLLVERLSGSAWEEFVRRRIFDPLGMKTSNFSVNDLQKTPDYALPYREQKGEVTALPFLNVDSIGPAGSINSTVNEMANWLLFHLGKGKFNGRQIISEWNLGRTHTPQMVLGGDLKYDESFYLSYAMAWIVTSYRGHLQLMHNGGIDGFTSQVLFLPKDQLGVVVLTNSISLSSGVIATNAVERMLGLSQTPQSQRAKEEFAKNDEAQAKAKAESEAKRKKDTRPSHALADYTGQFEHPAYQTLTITQAGDRLKFDLHGLTGELRHFHYDIFQVSESVVDLDGLLMTFVTNKEGEIDRVAIELESSVKEIVFTRKARGQEKSAQ